MTYTTPSASESGELNPDHLEVQRDAFNAWYARQPLPQVLARMDPQQAAFNAWSAALANQPAPTDDLGDEQWIFDLAVEQEKRSGGLRGPIAFSAPGLIAFAKALLTHPCALAHQPAQEQDSPAHETIVSEAGALVCTACGTTAQEHAEPVAWMDPSASCVMDAFLWQKDRSNPQYSVPVYTPAPQAPVAAAPDALGDQVATTSSGRVLMDAWNSGAKELAERALFERYEQGANLRRVGEGQYENPCVESAWEGWCARAALAASPVVRAQSEERAGLHQYRKKPVVIEAAQWGGNTFVGTPPGWIGDAISQEPGTPGFLMRISEKLVIETLEGQVWARPDDWILRGVKGELYPCKPDIFAATYEPAGAQQAHAGADEPPEVEQDALYDKAVMVVRAHRRASISLVQRILVIGYNRAARLLEAMERNGVVSIEDSAGRRALLPVPVPVDAAIQAAQGGA